MRTFIGNPEDQSRDFRSHALVALVALASLLPTAKAQFVQQGDKLVGTGAVSAIPTSEGNWMDNVALSGDGNTAIIGSPSADGNTGAALVYTRSGGAWTRQGGKLVGTGAAGAARQGWAVALSGDGNTAIITGPYNGLTDRDGAAWVFTRSGGVWAQQGGKLMGTGAIGLSSEPYAGQGWSVALSGDGNTAIVGGIFDNGSVGAAWVFARSGGVWTQQGKLVGTGAVGAALQGWSVGLSGDGNTAIVGGYGDTTCNGGCVGAAWVFTRSGGVWTQQGAKLVGADAVGLASQGLSVALSGDGNTAIVGGPDDNAGEDGDTGAAWVYTRSGGVWTQQGAKLVGTGSIVGAGQGSAVALSGDGNTAIVGGPLFGDMTTFGSGAAWVFKRSGGVWTQQGNRLVGTGAVGIFLWAGASVGLSSDGNTAIVGAPFDNQGTGAAWVFVNSGLSTVPSIASSGVVNGASSASGMVPNSWITIYGANLSSTTDNWDKSIVNGILPTTLDGVSVSVGGQPAYINYVSPGQINAVAPDIGAGLWSVTVANSNGTSAPASVVSQTAGPGFFLWAGKYAVATRQDFSWAVKNGTFPSSTTMPAKPGDVIILWGTGFGPTTPAAPVGVEIPSDKPYYTANPVSVTVGNLPALVYGTALAPGYAGLYQVAIQIPLLAPDGDLAVVATASGAQSPSSVSITVQR